MEEFLRELVERLEERLSVEGEGYSVSKYNVCKNNDTVLHSVVIRNGEEQISKSIYVEPYFAMNMRGMDFDEIVEKIITEYSNRDYMDEIIEESYKLIQYETVKDKLVIRLASKELNNEYLKDKLYVSVEDTDLVAIIYILISKGDSGLILTSVTQDLFDGWNIDSLDELYKVALENTMKVLPFSVKNMGTFVTVDDFENVDSDMINQLGNMMHVLTNDTGVNGATSILYDNVLKEFATAHNVEEIAILPSSRHEVILLPQNGDVDYRHCYNILNELNKIVVSEIDVLSNNIYIYNAITDKLTMWSEE